MSGLVKENSKKLNLVKEFNKLWKVKAEVECGEEELEVKEGFLDYSSVLMVVPKKAWVKNTIQSNFDVLEAKPYPTGLLDGFKGKDGVEVKGKYSTEFLKLVLDMTKNYETLIFRMNKDYPLWVECDDFILILAPRVDED